MMKQRRRSLWTVAEKEKVMRFDGSNVGGCQDFRILNQLGGIAAAVILLVVAAPAYSEPLDCMSPCASGELELGGIPIELVDDDCDGLLDQVGCNNGPLWDIGHDSMEEMCTVLFVNGTVDDDIADIPHYLLEGPVVFAGGPGDDVFVEHSLTYPILVLGGDGNDNLRGVFLSRSNRAVGAAAVHDNDLRDHGSVAQAIQCADDVFRFIENGNYHRDIHMAFCGRIFNGLAKTLLLSLFCCAKYGFQSPSAKPIRGVLKKGNRLWKNQSEYLPLAPAATANLRKNSWMPVR